SGSPALEIHAPNQLFIAGWKLLPNDKLVPINDFTLVVEIGRSNLDLIIRVLGAVVMDPDDPCWFRAGQLRTKLRTGDDDVFCWIRTRQHPCDVAAILPDPEQHDDSDEDQPPPDDPLPRSQQVSNGHYCRGASAKVIGISIFLLPRRIVSVTFSPALYRST